MSIASLARRRRERGKGKHRASHALPATGGNGCGDPRTAGADRDGLSLSVHSGFRVSAQLPRDGKKALASSGVICNHAAVPGGSADGHGHRGDRQGDRGGVAAGGEVGEASGMCGFRRRCLCRLRGRAFPNPRAVFRASIVRCLSLASPGGCARHEEDFSCASTDVMSGRRKRLRILFRRRRWRFRRRSARQGAKATPMVFPWGRQTRSPRERRLRRLPALPAFVPGGGGARLPR